MVDLKRIIVQEILMRAIALKDKYTKEYDAMATWACIFAQSENEYNELIEEVKKYGEKLKDTYSGPIFILNEPIGRTIRVLKIRQFDPAKKERGDADFTVKNYENFKKESLGKNNFKLIPRDGFEMIELMESGNNVLAYFSNPPIEEQYKDFI